MDNPLITQYFLARTQADDCRFLGHEQPQYMETRFFAGEGNPIEQIVDEQALLHFANTHKEYDEFQGYVLADGFKGSMQLVVTTGVVDEQGSKPIVGYSLEFIPSAEDHFGPAPEALAACFDVDAYYALLEAHDIDGLNMAWAELSNTTSPNLPAVDTLKIPINSVEEVMAWGIEVTEDALRDLNLLSKIFIGTTQNGRALMYFSFDGEQIFRSTRNRAEIISFNNEERYLNAQFLTKSLEKAGIDPLSLDSFFGDIGDNETPLSLLNLHKLDPGALLLFMAQSEEVAAYRHFVEDITMQWETRDKKNSLYSSAAIGMTAGHILAPGPGAILGSAVGFVLRNQAIKFSEWQEYRGAEEDDGFKTSDVIIKEIMEQETKGKTDKAERE